MRILAVGAHADDIEICCSATLAKYAAAGHAISIAIMTDGATGSKTIPSEDLVLIRKKEARDSANVIGADFYWLDFPDGGLANTIEERMALGRVIRAAQPELIITHNPEDYISDHRITSTLVTDAGLWAHVETLEPMLDVLKDSPTIAYMDTLGGIGFVPERYIDVSDYYDVKKKMLACHKSQQAWLSDYGNVDYMDMIEICGRYRGIQSGVRYAEGFRIWQGWQTTKVEPVMPV